jgi:hypothetical protein
MVIRPSPSMRDGTVVGPPPRCDSDRGKGGRQAWADTGRGLFGMSYLAIEVSQTDPKNMALTADAIGRFVQFFQTRLAPLAR